MEPVEINNGTWYLRGLRYDDRVDDRPALADLGETDLDYVHDAEDGWADDTRYTWAVCEPSTGELLAEITLDPKRRSWTAGRARARGRRRDVRGHRPPIRLGGARPAGAHVSPPDPIPPSSARPKVVTVTGAAGQIGYAALFRIGAGALLGRGVPVTLRLLELPSAVRAAEGVVMELVDSAFELLCDVEIHDDPVRAFDGVDVALLVGAKPRSKGMERADLLAANAAIFAEAGRALNAGAAATSGSSSSATRPTRTRWSRPRTRRTSPPSGSPR